jgi:hypothetical protein
MQKLCADRKPLEFSVLLFYSVQKKTLIIKGE